MAVPNSRTFVGIHCLTALTTLAMAIAVCIIVDVHLWTYVAGRWGWNTYVVVQNDCYLGVPNLSTNLCSLNWGLSAWGAFFVLFVFFFSLCSIRRSSQAGPCILVALAVATAVFVAQAGVNTKYVPQANTYYDQVAAQIPGQDNTLNGWRSSVLGLSWACFGVCLVGCAAALVDLVNNKPAPGQAPQFMFDGGPGYPPAQPGYGAGYPQPGYYPQGVPPPGAYGAPPPGPYGAPPPGPYGAPPPGQSSAPPSAAYPYPEAAKV